MDNHVGEGKVNYEPRGITIYVINFELNQHFYIFECKPVK
jgi:hypothetical protein